MSKLLLNIIVIFSASLAQLVCGYDSIAYKDPHYDHNRTTMVHLFEWKFKDIAKECETFLGPMGYAGVQISPINENVIIENRPWYERYQPISYKIITRSGNENDFKDMVDRCNAVGVRIYVDAVINHMTGDIDPSIGTGRSTAEPKKLQYPAVPYGPGDFNNPCGIENYNDRNQVRNCDLSGLHDLNQGKEWVREKIVEFLNHAIDLGVAGFRVDAAKHMWPGDLEIIYSRMKNLRSDVFGENKRPFIFQEVIDISGQEEVKKGDYKDLGCVIEFTFGNVLGRIFRGWQPMRQLQNWGFPDNRLLPSSDVVVMIDNHDNQRGHGAGGDAILNYKTPRLYKMAVAFMLAHPYGHPRVMSDVRNGAEANACGHGWVCEHRWSQIYGMVDFRNIVQDATFNNWWSNGGNKIAFSRGNLGFVAFNGEYGVDLKETLQTGMEPGDYCDVISGRKVGGKCTGKTVRVKDDGTAYIEILKDEADGVLAFYTQVIVTNARAPDK